MTQQTISLNLGAGAVLSMPANMATELERALREHRQRGRPRRDLIQEIEVYLRADPGATASEIARGIRARDEGVRAILNGNDRFERVSPPPGRSRRVIAWDLTQRALGAVPPRGTSARVERERS